MAEEFDSLLTRVRIASIQAEARSRMPRSGGSVVRLQRSKVTTVKGPTGSRELAKRRVVRARRET